MSASPPLTQAEFLATLDGTLSALMNAYTRALEDALVEHVPDPVTQANVVDSFREGIASRSEEITRATVDALRLHEQLRSL